MALLLKQFINHFGLDLKSTDINRRQEYASDMMNAQYRKSGVITKREGHRTQADNVGGAGLVNYNRINPTSGLREEILLSLDDQVNRLYESTFTVTYAGAELSCSIDIFLDGTSQTYKCQINEGTSLVLDYDLGLGVDEVTPIKLADLKTQIDLVTDFSAVVVGDDQVPAAYVDLKRAGDLVSGTVETKARYWLTVNTPLSTVFASYTAKKNEVDFENASSVQLNNILYLSNGYDEVIKYDGQNAYRSGMPTGSTPSPAVGAGGSLTGTYDYVLVYTQFDAIGNIIEGVSSPESTTVNPSAQSIDVTLTNILAASGFNTNCGIVAGAQGPVNTITLDDAAGGDHTLLAGDTAYFFDSVSGDYVSRNVDSVTASTITIAGAAVTVADNAVFSNNLRISLYRSLNGGTSKFLVGEFPNDSFNATQIINDDVVDNSLGIQYITPVVLHGVPPKGKYLSSYNNQMFVGGSIENPNFVFWSGATGPEYFDSSLLNLRLQSPNGDKISGLKQSNEVMAVFENKAIHIISGDLASLNIRVETITKDIGCIAHATIQEVRGHLYFLSDRGVYSTVSGQLPRERSENVEPLFSVSSIIDDDLKPVLSRSVAVNNREKEQYVLFIPTESIFVSDNYANTNSIVLVEDYFRAAWLRWDNMNMASGATVYENNLYFVEKRHSVSLGAVTNYLYSQSSRGDNWDYFDVSEAVNFSYSSAWYHLNEPSVFKKWIRMKLFGAQDTDFNSFSVDISVEKDFVDELVVGDFVIDFGSGISGYGISEYGNAPYGDLVDPNRKHKIGPIKSKAIRLVVNNTDILENVDITGWEIQVAASYKAEIKE